MTHKHENTHSASRAAGGIGAVLSALLGGVARHADDVGRVVLRHADDVGGCAVRHADDLGRLTVRGGDDLLRGLDDVPQVGRALQFENTGRYDFTHGPEVETLLPETEERLLREVMKTTLRSGTDLDRHDDE